MILLHPLKKRMLNQNALEVLHQLPRYIAKPLTLTSSLRATPTNCYIAVAG
jgi:hypothetical protein